LTDKVSRRHLGFVLTLLLAILCLSVFSARTCAAAQSFHPARRDVVVGPNPAAAAVSDFDLDGNTDIAVLQGRQEGMLHILRGNGRGGLDEVWSGYCGNQPQDIAVLFINDDELPDLAVSLSAEGVLRTFYGEPGGQFVQGESLNAGLHPSRLNLCDIEGDGEDEVIVATAGELVAFKCTQQGGLTEFSRYPLVAPANDYSTGDVNSDGFMDIAIAYEAGSTYIFFGDGQGGILSVRELELIPCGEGVPVDLEIVDLDLDGDRDLLCLDSSGEWFQVLWGNGEGEFEGMAVRYCDFVASRIVPGPVGESGIRDVLSVSVETGEVLVHAGRVCGIIRGNGYIGEKPAPRDTMGLDRVAYCFNPRGKPYKSGLETLWADFTDVDANGIPDMLTLNRGSGSLSVFSGAGGGFYHRAPDFKAGPDQPGAKSVAILDANEDGNNDVAVALRWVDAVSILLGDGRGNLSYHGEFPIGGHGAHTLGVEDLNEDGHADIVVRSVTTATVSVLLGDGEAGFDLLGVFQTDLGTHLVTIVDINMDDHLDVITPNAMGGTVTILLGDGTGYLQHFADVPVGKGPHSSVAIDFDKDEDPDIATADMGDNSVSILENEGGMLYLVEKIPVGAKPISICSGDFDEDGVADLATANIAGFSLSILFGSGSGSFQIAYPDILVGNGPHYVITGDLDSDGHLDLVSAMTGMDAVVVCFGDGQGNFSRREYYGVGDNPNTVAIGDLNNDNKPDIVSGNGRSSDVSVLFNTIPVKFPPVKHEM